MFVHDGRLHAIEVKKSATPRREWARAFTPLRRLEPPFAGGYVACLAPQVVPLTEDVAAGPAVLL